MKYLFSALLLVSSVSSVSLAQPFGQVPPQMMLPPAQFGGMQPGMPGQMQMPPQPFGMQQPFGLQQPMAVNPGGMMMMPPQGMQGELPSYQMMPGSGAMADCAHQRFDNTTQFNFGIGGAGGMPGQHI
jgi:hypothetical protein